MKLDIVGKKHIYLGFSLILVALSLASIISFGFKEGIDFQGGTLWQLRFEEAPDENELRAIFEADLKQGVAISRNAEQGDIALRFGSVSEEEHQIYGEVLREQLGAFEEMSFQSIGPSIGRELRNRAAVAFLFALAAISFYIAYAFRKVSKPVSSWKYALIALITLFHDAIIPLGLLSFLGFWRNVEIDTSLVVALLVIVGFSVHDTIVVFDRIRENLTLQSRNEFRETINVSVNQTLARSINTSLTLILALVALYIWGPLHLRYFVLSILVGTVAGTYSSIFVASPLLAVWQGLSERYAEFRKRSGER